MIVAFSPHKSLTHRVHLGFTAIARCCFAAILVALGAVVSTVAIAATPAGERHISLTYDIFYGGIRATSLEVEVTLNGAGYRLESRVVAQGPFGWLTGFVSNAVSEGDIQDQDINLREHRTTSEWFGEQRSTELRPTINGGINAAIRPSPEEDDRDPVAPSDTIGTFDPLSASFKAARDIHRADSCKQTLPIFDGRRRYNLVFRETERTAIKSAPYSGPALRCRMELVRIAGFSRKPFLPRPETPPEAYIWLAQVNDGMPMIPVRMRVESSIATTMVHLTAINGAAIAVSAPPVTVKKGNDRVDGSPMR